MYLLHGLFGNYTDWISNTRIQKWAEDRNLAVVMPSGDNSFYVDLELPNNEYGKYIGEELVTITRQMFPLSHKREDTFIAGLSMGGFGAIRNGLKYAQTYGYIAALSSALNMFESPDMYLINEDCVFGDKQKTVNTDKNPRYLMENYTLIDKPKIYMACGTEDSLIHVNRKFKEDLIKHNFEVTYEEGKGMHDWVFWDTYIQRVLDWLPLDEKEEGLNSGHVTI